MAPSIQPAYLKPKDAAVYAGRISLRTLRRWTAEYSIPTYGPKGNLYRHADLDAFMADCRAFTRPHVRRGRAGQFTPVSA